MTKSNEVSLNGKTQIEKNDLGEFNTKAVVTTLHQLMGDVNKEKITADTVNAACNCAGRIADILRLHLDAARLSAKIK